jgi:hypothetical protein
MTSYNVLRKLNESYNISVPDDFTETPGYVMKIEDDFSVVFATPTLSLTASAAIAVAETIVFAAPTITTSGAQTVYDTLTTDCMIRTGEASAWAADSAATSLSIGSWTHAGSKFKTWLPFLVTEPQGTQILSAVLSLTASASNSSATCQIKIGCDNRDNATAPTSYDELNMVTMTSAYITDALVPAWTLDTVYTYNVTTAVQEILNKSGWAADHTLALLIMDNGSQGMRSRSFFSFHNGSKFATLTINT